MTMCTQCSAGFALVNNACVSTNSNCTVPNCLVCNSNGTCTQCITGYSLNNGTCVEDNPPCPV